jgi:hypothetical protein
MSCEGFEHGTRVRVLSDIEHFDTVIPEGTLGTVKAIDRPNHEIDVKLDGFGLIKGLSAHSFGPIAAAGLAF